MRWRDLNEAKPAEITLTFEVPEAWQPPKWKATITRVKGSISRVIPVSENLCGGQLN